MKREDKMESKARKRKRSSNVTSSKDEVTNESTKEEVVESEDDDDIENDPVQKTKNYFTVAGEKTATSGKTLADLNLHNKQQLEKAKEKIVPKHLVEKRQILRNIKRELFPWWFTCLQQQFNLLLYGFGSKRNLIEMFARTCLTKELFLVVYGYTPTVSIQTVLQKLTHDLFGYEGGFSSTVKHFDFVYDCFKNSHNYAHLKIPSKMYIIVHNIDGHPFRNPVAQHVFSRLAQLPQIHMIASIDHVNSLQLWDTNTRRCFNWVAANVNTFEASTAEMKYDEPLMTGGGGDVAANGVRNVLQSLTANARGIFKVLATHQLEGNGKENGLSYQEFYEKCRDQFLVRNEATMRTQLTEFKDHKMILSKRNKLDQRLYFYVPINSALLKQIVEEEIE